MAAQLLSGKGFEYIINMAGGIKAWNGEAAVGPIDQGLSLFSEHPSLEETLLVAYSLEQGLRDFYLSMLPRVADDAGKKVFQQLADIEIKHQDRLFAEYLKLTGASVSRERFEEKRLPGVVEGGLTTEEYLALFSPDLEQITEIIGLAMTIEAQAMDLYQRAADTAAEEAVRKMLTGIAGEERIHLNELGKLMDRHT